MKKVTYSIKNVLNIFIRVIAIKVISKFKTKFIKIDYNLLPIFIPIFNRYKTH